MFNIPPASLLGIDSSGLSSTPKTPEIVNSLIAMTNPMDSYNFGVINSSNASTPGSGVCGRTFNGGNMHFSQDSSHSSSSASPLDSPAGTNTTPSVQQTRSQLIKAGLKLSIQSKRKLSTCDSSSGSEQPNSKCSRRGDEDCDDSSDDDSEIKSTAKGLTPEDEDRRRRRRERNKIAATKCRLKKRERTQNLIKESEQLDTQNVDLKNQVRALEMERRKLLDMLQAHGSTCIRRGGLNIPPKLMQSPAQRYLADLDMDGSAETNNNNSNMNGNQNCGSSNGGNSAQAPMPNSQQMQQQQQQPQQRTVIPPMSTIKFSRSNDFKATASLLNGGGGVTSPATQHNHHHQQHQQHIHQQQQPHQQPPHQLPHHQHNLPPQLPQGYCKPSPTPQELGYLNSPSQESICLPSLTNGNAACNITAAVTTVAASADLSQLSEYIPNCDNSLGLVLSATGASATNGLDGCSSTTSTAGDSSSLISGVSSPLTVISSAPSSLTSEFVKNEMVDSHSPYTTAASAERFLFEGDIDIKHAISIHQHSTSLNHLGGVNVLGNNNNNLLDFHSSLMGGSIPLHEQISIKNDFLNDADLLGQFTDAGEFVDLDTGVAAAFMTNGGCLA